MGLVLKKDDLVDKHDELHFNLRSQATRMATFLKRLSDRTCYNAFVTCYVAYWPPPRHVNANEGKKASITFINSRSSNCVCVISFRYQLKSLTYLKRTFLGSIVSCRFSILNRIWISYLPMVKKMHASRRDEVGVEEGVFSGKIWQVVVSMAMLSYGFICQI